MCLLLCELSTPDEPCCFTFLKSYRWWKKSCTTWDIWNPVMGETTNLNWWVYRMSEPSTGFKNTVTMFTCFRTAANPRFCTQEIRLIEKAVATLGISKAAVKTNAGTKTAVVTHLSKVKADRHLASAKPQRRVRHQKKRMLKTTPIILDWTKTCWGLVAALNRLMLGASSLAIQHGSTGMKRDL